ncbi:uncharacterized protein LAESUDRAFT_672989 [Laetiporus sulphureus 93-53]|uniref:Uncharacterized protein n=1 Tax=Laetiporus sulphureus 93-53 TaxID=1314785 RepID=A0A165GFM0_9APHY|nr:uncharacterized protein LAESUDRAFT_672989 [Laetiporus sulphureus 93-53]KZT10282.1 hypothetical protein LAESUDRAFT_672989 [Laetiporus sulphureus 93-53]
MSSAIPTRRATRTTGVLPNKENSTARNVHAAASRAKPSSASAVENAKLSGIARPTASTRAKSVAPTASRMEAAPPVKPQLQVKRKREALSEVPHPPENMAAKPINVGSGMSSLKGKEHVDQIKDKFEGVVLKKTTTTMTTMTTTTAATTTRAPLRTVGGTTATATLSTAATTRRTKAPAASANPAAQYLEHQREQLHQLKEVKEEIEENREEVELLQDENAMIMSPQPPVAPVSAPQRVTAARTSAAVERHAIRPRTPKRAGRTPYARRPEEDEEADRAIKKRRTSSDIPDEEAAAEVEEAIGFAGTPDAGTSDAGTPEADPNGLDWEDLDAEDADDPLMVSEYVVEIFEYLKRMEQTTMPNPRYMETQKDLAWKMRGILMDWLIQVHARFTLLPETLFLCVNLIDRFLSARVVSLAKLQLVGVTCMFIASKVEEVIAPSVENFLHVADSSYNEAEILQAERYVLKTVDWNLSYPSPIHFLRRISKADDYNTQVRTVAKYLLEIQCLEWRLIAAPPSLLAAAAIWFARIILGFPEWTPNLAHYSSYAESELLPTANMMLNYVLKPIRHDIFYKKYASKRYLKASVYVRQWALERWHEGTNVNLAEVLPRLKELIQEQREQEEQEELAEAEAIAAAEAAAQAYYAKPTPYYEHEARQPERAHHSRQASSSHRAAPTEQAYHSRHTSSSHQVVKSEQAPRNSQPSSSRQAVQTEHAHYHRQASSSRQAVPSRQVLQSHESYQNRQTHPSHEVHQTYQAHQGHRAHPSDGHGEGSHARHGYHG